MNNHLVSLKNYAKPMVKQTVLYFVNTFPNKISLSNMCNMQLVKKSRILVASCNRALLYKYILLGIISKVRLSPLTVCICRDLAVIF